MERVLSETSCVHRKETYQIWNVPLVKQITQKRNLSDMERASSQTTQKRNLSNMERAPSQTTQKRNLSDMERAPSQTNGCSEESL